LSGKNVATFGQCLVISWKQCKEGQFHFGAAPDHDPDSGSLKRNFLPCGVVPVVRGLRDQLRCGVCGLPVILLQARKQGGPGGPGTPEHNGAQYSLAHVVNIKTYDRTQCMGR